MKSILLPLLIVSFVFFSCGEKAADTTQSNMFTVINPVSISQKDAIIRLSARELVTKFPAIDLKKISFSSNTEIPFQAIDEDQDGKTDEFLLLLNLEANAKHEIQLRNLREGEQPAVFPKRTQAEISHKINGQWKGREYEAGEFQNVNFLAVPPEHTDHSWFIRYEGPGWESDKVGYRFYLDWRNATDIFGKKTSQMVLQDVGEDGFDSYHEAADWGMDILKVGKSLGIGALGFWQGDSALRVETTDSVTCRIASNGVLESRVETRYFGWLAGGMKTDVVSEFSIQAGSRMTRHDISLSNPLPNLCTGIVKHEEGSLLQGEKGAWAYLASWGKQSLANDNLGMAIIYRTAEKQQVTEDEFSHVVVLTPQNQKLSYYFLAAWEQEKEGIKTQDMFEEYLEKTLASLNQPLEVNFP